MIICCNTGFAATKLIICLTGKVENEYSFYQSSLINGVKLAINDIKPRFSYVVKSYFFGNDPLSALSTYHSMIKDGCSAIIGFEYLSDLKLISKKDLNKKIPIISPYSSSLDGENIPKNILMLMPKYDYLVNTMYDFMLKKWGVLSNILIVTETDRPDLVDYKLSYEKIFFVNQVKYDEFNYVQTDHYLEQELKNFIAKRKYNFVIMLGGANTSIKILNTFNDANIKFIGTENFGSSNYQSVIPMITNPKVEAYVIRNIDYLSADSQIRVFKKRYEKMFFENPLPLSAYAYDAMSVVLMAYQKNHNFADDLFYKIDYKSITGITINNNIYHRSRKFSIINMRHDGADLCQGS